MTLLRKPLELLCRTYRVAAAGCRCSSCHCRIGHIRSYLPLREFQRPSQRSAAFSSWSSQKVLCTTVKPGIFEPVGSTYSSIQSARYQAVARPTNANSAASKPRCLTGYPGPDSNRYGFPHWFLRPARLPFRHPGLPRKTTQLLGQPQKVALLQVAR